MRSDSVWNMSALLTRITRQVSRMFDLNFAYILKRAKAQKKNPWKEEIFTDTRDYQEAMARAK